MLQSCFFVKVYISAVRFFMLGLLFIKVILLSTNFSSPSKPLLLGAVRPKKKITLFFLFEA